MDHALGVRVLEGAQDLARDLAGTTGFEALLAGEHLGKRLAGDEFHDQEELAGRAVAEVGDRNDVGVAQAAGRLRLALEAPRGICDFAKLGAQELERQHLLHVDVLDAKDRSHPPLADAAEDAVALADDRVGEGIPRDLHELRGGGF